jgi:dienelactone hydrolase
LTIDDAKAINIPHIVLASNGEDEKAVAEYKEVLVGEGKPGYVETYADQHHGWMGARANLSNARNKASELTKISLLMSRSYNKIAEFFGKYL